MTSSFLILIGGDPCILFAARQDATRYTRVVKLNRWVDMPELSAEYAVSCSMGKAMNGWVKFRGREDKLTVLGALSKDYLVGDVLDVGCDVKTLSPLVAGRYVGVDVKGTPDLIADLERGLPFRSKSFDVVVAVDVLEHLEGIHRVLDECCRVAHRYLIVGLPNMYEWRFRMAYLFGNPPSGKYGLPAWIPEDRHRWLFSLAEGREFTHQCGAKNGFRVVKEIFGYYDYRMFLPKLFGAVGRRFGRRWANLFAYHYWAVLESARSV